MRGIKKIHKTIISLIAVLVVVSCTKYDNPAPFFEELIKEKKKQRKVLLISIDGLSGEMLKNAELPNINSLKSNSKYTYELTGNGTLNIDKTGVSGWVNMVSGQTFFTHKIKDNSFTFEPGSDNDPHAEVNDVRNVLEYIADNRTFTTAVVTPWTELRDFLRASELSPKVSSDLAVKDSTLSMLKIFDLGTLIVNFKGLEDAFEANADPNSPAVVEVLSQTDKYIAEIITALEARNTFEFEDWLIILTSNRGGTDSDPKPGFLMMHNQALKEYELKSRGFPTIQFKGQNVFAETDYDPFDPGVSQDFTVQCDVNFAGANDNTVFLSNGENDRTEGWYFQMRKNKWRAFFNNPGASLIAVEGSGNEKMILGDWHNIAITVKSQGNQRVARVYTDGKFGAEANIAGLGDLGTENNFRIGYSASSGGGKDLDFYATNLKYYNKALSSDNIAANVNRKDILTDPDLANLIGYWTMDDGVSDRFFNKAPMSGPPLVFKEPIDWLTFDEDPFLSKLPKPVGLPFGEISSKALQVDITPAIMYWLGIPVDSKFKIEGSELLNLFEDELFVTQ